MATTPAAISAAKIAPPPPSLFLPAVGVPARALATDSELAAFAAGAADAITGIVLRAIADTRPINFLYIETPSLTCALATQPVHYGSCFARWLYVSLPNE